MEKKLFQSLLGILFLLVFSLTNTVAQTSSAVVKFTINIRNNVSVEIGATIISKSQHGKKGNSMLVLNGTGQTAKTFTTLAESVIASDANVSTMILLDYPGHGNSGTPVGGGVKFGDLTMDDYVTALLASLDRLDDLHIKPNALMGHSLGAEIIQMAQTRLANNGDTLRHKFGIKAAVFLVPDIPSPLSWAAIDAGAADPLAAIFVRNDQALGDVFDLLTIPGGMNTWMGLFYANRTGTIVSGGLTPSQAVENGFVAFEPGTMVKQLIGLPDAPGGARKARPTISSNIFSNSKGTTVGVVSQEQDGLYIFPVEHKAVYEFITGDYTDELFFALTGTNSVHNAHTITPGIYNNVIKQVLAKSDNDDDNEQ